MTRLPTLHSKLQEASKSSFNMQRSNFSNKDGQQLQGEINQIKRNLQLNQGKPKSSGLEDNYNNAMRSQQEANLARIRNQLHRSSYNHPSKQSGNIYQNIHQATSRNQPQYRKHNGNIPPNQNRQPNLPRQVAQNRQNHPGNYQPQVQNQQLRRLQTQIRNSRIQPSISKQTVVNSISHQSTRQVKAMQQTNNTTQPIPNSSTKLTQEAMLNNIAKLQQQIKLGSERLSKEQNTSSQSTTNKKLLEDMTKSKSGVPLTYHLITLKIKKKITLESNEIGLQV